MKKDYKQGYKDGNLNGYLEGIAEIRKRILERLRYCQKQNGLPYCPNCGLSYEEIKWKNLLKRSQKIK